jgi:hypothetical protein
MKTSTSLIACALLAGACTGTVEGTRAGEPGAGSGSNAPPHAGAAGGAPAAQIPTVGDAHAPLDWAPAPTTRFARLSHRQYENVARDLLRLQALPVAVATFTGDPRPGRFDNASDALIVSQGLHDDYQRAAEAIADRATSDPAALARIAPATDADVSARLRTFVGSFGLRAYRRPLTAAEVSRYVALGAQGPSLYDGMEAFAAGARVVIEAMLQSPHFLYRTELATGSGARVALSAYEVAAKLALALTSTLPDDELFDAAAANALGDHGGVSEQAKRLLATAAAAQVLEDFHAQLLLVARFASLDKDPKLFPDFTPDVGADMQQESLRFARSVTDGGGGLRDLLLAPYSFVNERLAKLYGATGVTGSQFRKVDLDPARRSGVLTQLGFLATNAGRSTVDTIHRGVYVHTQVLCTTLPPPVANAVFTNPSGRTNRERVEANTGKGTCGESCHFRIINPIGFGFESYDALGRYQTTDNGYPIDASGAYAFGGEVVRYANGVEMIKAIAASGEAHRCFASAIEEFLHGRLADDAEASVVTALGARSMAGVGTRDLVLAVVTSDNFLYRLP